MKLYSLILLSLALLGALPPAHAATPSPPSPATQAPADTININSAGVEQLRTLPGIGPSTAEAIVRWREQEGAFKDVDQLLAIKGIGEKTLARFRDRLSL